MYLSSNIESGIELFAFGVEIEVLDPGSRGFGFRV